MVSTKIERADDENKVKCTYGCGSYVLTTELSNHLLNYCNKRYVICDNCTEGKNTLISMQIELYMIKLFHIITYFLCI